MYHGQNKGDLKLMWFGYDLITWPSFHEWARHFLEYCYYELSYCWKSPGSKVVRLLLIKGRFYLETWLCPTHPLYTITDTLQRKKCSAHNLDVSSSQLAAPDIGEYLGSMKEVAYASVYGECHVGPSINLTFLNANFTRSGSTRGYRLGGDCYWRAIPSVWAEIVAQWPRLPKPRSWRGSRPPPSLHRHLRLD